MKKRIRVIPTIITVKQPGQKINFDIKLPASAKKIVGLQFSITARTSYNPH